MIAHDRLTTGNSTSTVRRRPNCSLVAPNARALSVSCRELLHFSVWRDLKVRYMQTVFGARWAVTQPFILIVVFSLFLGRISEIALSDMPYPLFAFAGLVSRTLFSSSGPPLCGGCVALEALPKRSPGEAGCWVDLPERLRRLPGARRRAGGPCA